MCRHINILLNLVSAENINLHLHGKTKKAAINELLDILAVQGRLLARDTALKDLLDREQYEHRHTKRYSHTPTPKQTPFRI
jgi:hypothetical protein